jgi:spermidine synthase
MIYGLFFISGACGLIYQVVWVRLFGLVFGNTIYSSSTVLAAFMAGLAVGSVAGGAFLAKRPNKLTIYALLELGIGLTGACMPLAVQAGYVLYAWLFQTYSPSPAMLTFVRFIISFSTLIVPASLMGATLPVISECISENTGKHTAVIGWLYGLNTLGAFIGCYSAGFILIGRVGIVATGCIAAALNCAIAGAALLWNKKFNLSVKAKSIEAAVAGQSPSSATPATGRLRTALFITALLSGFASLALEVAWFKALSWTMGMDSYAFAGMLSVVLSGIGLGSVIYSLFVKKLKPGGLFLSILLFSTGVAIFCSMSRFSVP